MRRWFQITRAVLYFNECVNGRGGVSLVTTLPPQVKLYTRSEL